MRFALRPCAPVILAILTCLTDSTVSAETFSSLPPPPDFNTNGHHLQYMLELVVNEQDGGEIVPVERRDNDFWVGAGDLQRAGIPPEKLTSPLVNLTRLPQVDVHYDEPGQRLLINVPPDWLPLQAIAPAQENTRYPAQSSRGGLFNYDFYTTRTDNAGSRLSALHELRLFGDHGQFSSNGVWLRPLSGTTRGVQEGYIRYDSGWSNENENQIIRWRVGDLISDALSWSSSVRLGGVQMARDFSVRPDLVTYPLPEFSGQAAVPSTLDLFVNGYRTRQANVQPGPYTLTNLPFVNGAGDAVIVTTDAAGRQVTSTLPFYVSSRLLKPGLSDYAFSAGALRENYGLSSFDYGAAAASGSFRYGLTRWLTLESHAEGTESLAMGGAGALVNVGSLGVLNGALARSQMADEAGNQYSWGYQYNTSVFSIGTQHTLRTPGFSNLALHGNRPGNQASNGSTLSRRSAQYNASLSLSHLGSIGAAFIDIRSASGERTQLWNLSWSKNLWGNSSLYVSASRDRQQDAWSGAVSLVIPFADHGSSSLSVERNQQGKNAQRVYLSRAMPSEGGFAWDASWAHQGGPQGDYRQGSLRWRNNKIDTSAGFYGDADNGTQWGEVSGALVLMDNRVFAANQINDAFVLVKTGYPAVNVRYENQSMGRTDNAGYLLVPSISSYYPAKYDIDTLDLPANLTAPRVEQRFAVKRQSGFMLNFPIEPLRAASVILHDQHHQPLPVSSQVLRPGQADAYVGWDGLAYLENLSRDNPMQVVTPDGRRCTTQLTLAQTQPRALKTYGPLICSLPAASNNASVASPANSLAGMIP